MIPGVLLGFASVLQAGLNRRIGEKVGIPCAVVFNNTVLLIASVALVLITKLFLNRPDPTIEVVTFSFWYLIPGILGLSLVAGIPYAIAEFGAVRVFTPLIFSQILGSLLWDFFLEGQPLSQARIVGAAITCAGALLCQVSN